MRAVEDDDVDRPQVQAWRHVQPSGTNSPKRLEKNIHSSLALQLCLRLDRLLFCRIASGLVLDSLPYTGVKRTPARERNSGDDSARAPPLPIPNREVKPCHADGTAKAGEQVIAVLFKSRFERVGFFIM